MAEREKIAPLLMFSGKADEAMAFYTSLFADSSIGVVARYGPEYPGGTEGQVVHAAFRLNGQLFMAMDNAAEPAQEFTQAISFFVTCEDEAEIDRLYAAFMDGGTALMELQRYSFATKYAWVRDRFGVTWQLNLT